MCLVDKYLQYIPEYRELNLAGLISILICGNKNANLMQQRFLLQILLFAQHVSGTAMPIIRSSRVLYSGYCLWYFVLWFSSCWYGEELRVMCPVCRMLLYWLCFVACIHTTKQSQ